MNTTEHANARFWIWANGWVKITLRPGQRLTHESGGPTDEGFSYTAETWTHEGDHVRSEWEVNASDCDGRLDRGGASCCPLDKLRARDMHAEGFQENVGIFAPEWQDAGRYQRDYAAEAAGY